jgi:hypothetical protein
MLSGKQKNHGVPSLTNNAPSVILRLSHKLSERMVPHSSGTVEKVLGAVILSEAKNLSPVSCNELEILRRAPRSSE